MNNFIIINKDTKEEFIVLSLEPGYGSGDDDSMEAFYLIANTKTGALDFAKADTIFKDKYTFKKLITSGDAI